MKTKKIAVLSVIFAVIIILAVGIFFAVSAKTKNGSSFKIYQDVLLGNKQFLYVSENGTEEMSISDVPAIFDPYDEYMTIWDISAADLDSDDSPEAIMSVFGVSGDTGGKFILHGMNGKIYG